MRNLKLHANLKWATIIDRINKIKGCEMFKIIVDTLYIYDKDAYICIGTTASDKESFINNYA